MSGALPELYSRLGLSFVGLASIFALGLRPQLGLRIYLGSYDLLQRLAAPAIFAALAAACFVGIGFQALVLTAVAGTVAALRWRITHPS